MDYATKRTPRRILILISIIWITSIVISSSHLFSIFRNKHGLPPDQCHINGNIPYTIISTIGAFYIPLIVMCVIYWKIFQAARFRIRRKGFNTDRSLPSSSAFGATATPLTRHRDDISLLSETTTPNLGIHFKETKYQSFSPLRSKNISKESLRLSDGYLLDIKPDTSSLCLSTTNQRNNLQLRPLKRVPDSFAKKKHNTIVTMTTKTTPVVQLFTTNRLNREYEDLRGTNSATSVPLAQRFTTSLFGKHFTKSVNKVNNTITISNSFPSNPSHLIDRAALKLTIQSSKTSTKNINSHGHDVAIIREPPGSKSRKKIDIKRERKATKVLGIIMGCFVLCWLPFFIKETMGGLFHLSVNDKVSSVLTWLGYLNSLLNPVIYTTVSPDFRRAFGKILFGKYSNRR